MVAPKLTWLPIFCAVAAGLFTQYGHAATVTVDSIEDTPGSTSCTLRNAIGLLTLGPNTGSCVVSGVLGAYDTIVFEDSLVKSTISLAQGALEVDGTNPITIAGTGQIIDAHQQSRDFYVIGALHLSGLTITGGHTSGNGGAFKVLNLAKLKVDSSAIENNRAANGGAIYSTGSVVISNSTIANNYASQKGGAAYIPAGQLQATDVTVSANSAGGKTGGIYLNGGSAWMRNSVMSGNSAPMGSDLYSRMIGNIELSYCAISSNTPLGDYIAIGRIITTDDPMLSPLGDHGGLTPTMLPLERSPLIDQGDNNSAIDTGGQLLDFDQRGGGYPRINNDVVDIGAAEFANVIFTNGFE